MQENPYTRSVKSLGKQIYWLLIPVAGIVLVDEWLKKMGLVNLPGEETLVNPSWIEFVIHKNFGIAFDIPFRLWIIVLISIIIGCFLLEMAWKNVHSKPSISFSAMMIVLGALGNLYDRVAYGFTVDYILLFGRSAINLSDILILLGVVMLLMSSRKRTSN